MLTLRQSNIGPPVYAHLLDYDMMEDGQSIGRIMEQRELLPGRKWAWYLQITGAHRAGVDTWGYAASLEDAKTAFHASLEGYRAAEQKASDEHFLGLGARNRSLFCVGAVGTFTFARSDDPRLRNFLAAATFFLAAAGSYYLDAWWPLIVGFGLLWVYKLMGLDPADDHR